MATRDKLRSVIYFSIFKSALGKDRYQVICVTHPGLTVRGYIGVDEMRIVYVPESSVFGRFSDQERAFKCLAAIKELVMVAEGALQGIEFERKQINTNLEAGVEQIISKYTDGRNNNGKNQEPSLAHR